MIGLFISHTCTSCDCNGSIGFKEADIVFVGKVVRVENQGRYKITFRVCRIEKGKHRKKELVVYTPCLTDPCCGINFQKDSIYRVYALTYNKEFTANLCTETTLLDK